MKKVYDSCHMAKILPFQKDYIGTGQSAKPRLDLDSGYIIAGIIKAQPMESPDAFHSICLSAEGKPVGKRPIPFKQRFYCVYEQGQAVYNHPCLTNCFRYIANRLNSRTGFATMKQAMDAGFEVRAV